MQRRENLKRSAADLKLQLDDAKAVLAEAFEEMKKVELLDERHHSSSSSTFFISSPRAFKPGSWPSGRLGQGFLFGHVSDAHRFLTLFHVSFDGRLSRVSCPTI